MAVSRPVICTSLHLPPDPQPLLRIHEISLYIFLPNLERLQHDLKTAQDIYPNAYIDFHETLSTLTFELVNVFRTLQIAQIMAERYHKVLDTLKKNLPTDEALFRVNLSAGATVFHAKSGQESLSEFRREFERGIERARTTPAAKDKKSREPLLNSAKNSQRILEILLAIDECDELLQRCQDHFGDLEKRTRNNDAIDSDPPTEEETQLIHEKWDIFLEAIKDVYEQGFEIATEISMSTSDTPQYYTPENREPRQKIPLCRAIFQQQDTRDLVRSKNVMGIAGEAIGSDAVVVTPCGSHEMRTNVSVSGDATKGHGVAAHPTGLDVGLSDGPTLKGSKIPFWRKVFRCINGTDFMPPSDESGKNQTSDVRPDASGTNFIFWGLISCFSVS